MEIALAVFVGLYVLILVLWLAYQGRSLGRAQIPGGGGFDLPDPDHSAAADDFDEYRSNTNARLTALEESIDLLKQSRE